MPLFDFLLLMVIVLTAYLGPMVVRRLGPGHRMYGWMLVGDLVLAIIALASRKSEGPNATADLLGTVAIGGAISLVMVPPLLRNLARRALVADRLVLARWLVDFRELLQPHMGARQESELISTIIEVRSGQVDAAVARLRERRDQIAEPLARRPVDERIIMTYLYARRWDDAAAWFEVNLRQQGMSPSPQLSVEMVRAYCERGQLDKAASLVEELEGSAGSEEPIWTLLLSRARLVFLAFVGKTGAVEAILAPSGPLAAMPEAARCFWSGLARLKAGDVPGARTSLERAAALSGRDGRARELAEATLLRIDEPGVAGPPPMTPLVAELAERLSRMAEDAPSGSAAPPTSTAVMATDPDLGKEPGVRAARRARGPQAPRLSGVSWREVPVTTALVLANLAAFVAVYALTGTVADVGALAAAGGLVKAATLNGDYWRLGSSMFLHMGLLHLVLNMYGLWVLGRLVEQFLGSTRMFVVYVAAGLVGAAASLTFGGPATSVGASGAVFGLLGAAVAELALHRKAYPKRWSGALLGNLVFLAVANVIIGLMYPMIDQSAHLGGLAGGLVTGALLSRRARWADLAVMRGAVIALVMAAAAALGYSGVGVFRSDLAETLASYPRSPIELGGAVIDAPENWEIESDTQANDPSMPMVIDLRLVTGVTPSGIAGHIATRREEERSEGAKQLGFDRARLVDDVLLEPPAPWKSLELEVEADSGVGGVQVFRVAAMGREAPGGMYLVSIIYPASLADELGPLLREVLASARPSGAVLR